MFAMIALIRSIVSRLRRLAAQHFRRDSPV